MEYNVQSMSPTSGGRGSANGAFIMQPEQMMHQQPPHHMSKRASGGGGVHHGGELHHDEIMMHHQDDEDGSTIAPNGNGPSSMKYSLLQFAMQHFRNE